MAKKSLREKLDEIEEKIHVITPEYEPRYGKGKLLVASARDVERVVRLVPRGQLIHNDLIREYLRTEKDVQAVDPMTIGIFLRIIAETAEEERGQKEITPYWRVVKPDGSINPKLPGGQEGLERILKEEGHELDKSRKVFRVVDFENKLIVFD